MDRVVQLTDVAVRYRLPKEGLRSLKEFAIRWFNGKVGYEEFWALNNVSLEVERGSVLGVIGQNGAGKSTLLKVIARVIKPKSGQVIVQGKVAPLLELGAGFDMDLTGRENIYLNGAILGFSKREMWAKFEGIVDFAELWGFIDAPLRTYSTGMIARLGFAIATDVDPDVLLIDEVLAVGDERFQRRCRERINSFRKKGTTIVLVSHHLEVIRSLCNRAVWIEQGYVRASGAVDYVTEAYARFLDNGKRENEREMLGEASFEISQRMV